MKKLLLLFLLAIALPIHAPPHARADIAANDARDTYTGNGATTAFTYGFKILDQAHIAVYVAGTLQTITTHYTVTGIGNDAGGTITFVAAPANGAQVLFLRAQPIEQASVYTSGSISATQIERDFDRQTAINQQQQEQLDRAVQFSRTVSGITTSFTPAAGQCFGLNDAGTAVASRACEGGGGGGGSGDLTSVSGTAGEITVASGAGPDPVVSIATDLNLSSKVLQGGTPLVFEGASSDGFETSVVVTDPTADRTVTIPNADSVTVQPSTAGASQFATGVSSLGVVSYAQPTFSGITGSVTDAQVPDNITITVPANSITAAHIDETTDYTWTGDHAFTGTLVTPGGTYSQLPGTPATNMRFIVTDCLDDSCSAGSGAIVREMRYTGTEWTVLSGGASSTTPTLDEVFDAGAAGTRGVISGATEAHPVLIEGNDSDYAVVLRVTSSNSPEVIGKCAGVIGGCDRTFSHNAGKKTEFTDSDGNVEVSYTEDVGFTKLTIDAEVSGRVLTHNGTAWRAAQPVKSVQVVVVDFGTATSTGDGKFYFRVPPTLNNYVLTAVSANVITAGTTGTINVDLARCAAAATGNVCSGTVSDMLSTNLTIDSGENDSSTAAAAAVINTTNDDVTTGMVIRVDIDAVHTTPANGLVVNMDFTAP